MAKKTKRNPFYDENKWEVMEAERQYRARQKQHEWEMYRQQQISQQTSFNPLNTYTNNTSALTFAVDAQGQYYPIPVTNDIPVTSGSTTWLGGFVSEPAALPPAKESPLAWLDRRVNEVCKVGALK